MTAPLKPTKRMKELLRLLLEWESIRPDRNVKDADWLKQPKKRKR